MKFIFLLFILVVFSCNNAENKKAHIPSRTDSLKTKLLGNWGSLDEDIPMWEIRMDSIYYYEENRSYPYSIINEDFIIERDSSKGILRKISVVEDTMTFYDEQGFIIKGYRKKIRK